jgi:hypothetical protein
MTGAKHLAGDDTGLQFSLPGGGFCRDGINKVRVTLNSLDLYDVDYYRYRRLELVKVAESRGLYADMLTQDFTEKTGLAVSLGTCSG